MRYPFSLLQHPTAIPEIWRTHHADQAAQKREYEPEILHQHTHQALQTLLHHAYHTVPFYRDLWYRHGVTPEQITHPADLHNLPLVSKAYFQQQPYGKLMSTMPHKAWPVLSSGTTTGTRRFALRDANADLANSLTIRRYFREYGVSSGDNVIFLHAGERNPIYSEMRWRELGTSRVHVHALEFIDSPKCMKEANVIAGPASQLEYVARHYAKIGIKPPKLFVNYAERMSPAARARIKALTDTAITDVYCASELSTLIGFTCPHNTGFHVNTDYLLVEVVNERDKPCQPGEQGEVVVTDLVNFVAPLIRYRLGDVVTVGEGRSCPCGRALPTMIERVEGRAEDKIESKDRTLHLFPFLEQLDARLGNPFTLIQRNLTDFILEIYVINQENQAIMPNELQKLFDYFLEENVQVKIISIPFQEIFHKPQKIRPFISG